ncbi:MAG: hypothetical protein U0P46_12370 [Holophagaceae bacterium]
MDQPKLIETRGEEPAFLPGHVGESWQRVDFGLGASTLQSSPEVQETLPPQNRHWGRMIGYAVTGAAAVSLAILLVRVLSKR